MRLYKYTFGDWEKYGPANDDADAYERRVSVDPQFHYVPVTIEEVKLEGYEIAVSPINPVSEKTPYDGWDKPKLRAWLDENNVEYVPQWGESRLKELIMQQINS